MFVNKSEQNKITEFIKKHEGLRLKVYKDTVGVSTVGYGHNIEDNGISQAVADLMLKEDVEIAVADCHKLFKNYDRYSARQKAAVISMSFNLGYSRLSKFKKMIAAMNKGNYKEAARQALASKWAGQVHGRATEIAYYLQDQESVHTE